MRTRFRLLICYQLVAFGAFALPATGAEPEASRTPPLACTIRSAPTCELGKAPTITVEISNWTAGEIYLVGSLDASDCKWRYPHCYFEVWGPDGQSAVREPARCGNKNGLRVEDFVKVSRGGKFDPYQKIDEYGFFSSSQISAATFRVEGEYRIRFVYSTDSAALRPWLGDGRASEEIVKMLAKVPKTTVSSNEITIKIVPPSKK